jgi:dolichol-phosphate mannosyltransferase
MSAQDLKPQEGAEKQLLCLVIPTYNESENIETLVERVELMAATLTVNFKAIFVDDNSQDGTAESIKRLQEKYSNLVLIQRPKPTGLGSAYLDAFSFAINKLGANYVGEMDADLQHPPELISSMCNKALLEGKDVILGSRYVPGGGAAGWSFGRRIISRGANGLSKIFLRVPVADSTTGFRIIRAETVKNLFDYKISAKGYAFQVESLYLYKKCGATFAEVPYNFETRRAGKTKLDWKEMVRFAYITMKTGIFGIKKNPDSNLPAEKLSKPIVS